jgi:membrane-associated progesterone receptor component
MVEDLGKIGVVDVVKMIGTYTIESDPYKKYISKYISEFLPLLSTSAYLNFYAGSVTVTISVLATFSLVYLSCRIFQGKDIKIKERDTEDEVIVPTLRDFTIEQLRDFDGVKKPKIYIALKGDVYDVSEASGFYGEGSGYHCFAGREASRAMARLSFDEEDLKSLKLDDLSPFDKSNLDDWVDKFRNYKAYPIVGRVSTPPPIREFRLDELKHFLGDQEVPVGRVHSPIYVAINGKILDVSYGKISCKNT